MNKQKINIWDRDFELNIIYDCYPGEKVTEYQQEAVVRFFENDGIISNSLVDVKSYVIENGGKDNGINTIENVFKYVMPKSIYVPRNSDCRSIVILCDYKFDMEHGMAIVFENEKFKMIGSEDIVL